MEHLSVDIDRIKEADRNELVKINELQVSVFGKALINADENEFKKSEEICDMLKMLSHDIRSPLVTIGTTLKLLKRGAYGVFNEGANNELDKLLKLVIQATGVMEDLMGMAFSLSSSSAYHREILNIR